MAKTSEAEMKIKVGDRLYHGTSVEDDFEIPDGPAWFSDSSYVADYFASWHGGLKRRILEYEVIVEPNMVVWLARFDIAHWLEQLGYYEDINDPQELAEIVCDQGLDGWIIPDNYPEGADILLCYPEDFLELVGVDELD